MNNPYESARKAVQWGFFFMGVPVGMLVPRLAEIKAGTLKALATTASKRIPGLPDVPTVRELGFPGLELEGWNGLFVHAKTPRDIIDRLQRESAAAVRHPDVVKRLTELGAEAVGSNGAAQEEMLKRQMDQFRPVIKDMKID